MEAAVAEDGAHDADEEDEDDDRPDGDTDFDQRLPLNVHVRG